MPEWLHSLLLRLKAVRHRRRLDQDLEDEIAFHLAMKAECSGDTEARRQFGTVALQKESLREAWSFPRIESWLQDARHAVRALSKTPVFATVAILSLAIGIGANASIFTVLNTFFLRSLPVQNPQDLRVINWTGKPGDLVHSSSGYGSEADGIRTSSSFSFEAFQEIEKQTTVLSSVAAFQNFRANAVARSQALVAPAQLVSGRFFETLGMQAALGRTLLPSDNTLGAPPVAVISWRLYERLYAANADALGSELRVDKVPCTVIGVLPPNVYGISATDPVDVYVPLARTDEFSTYELNDPNYWWIQVFRPREAGDDRQPGASRARRHAGSDHSRTPRLVGKEN